MVVFNLAKDEDTKVKNLESDRLAEKENSKRKTNVGTDQLKTMQTLMEKLLQKPNQRN